MDREQANAESSRQNPGSRSLCCVWYCGRINDEIRKVFTLTGFFKLFDIR